MNLSACKFPDKPGINGSKQDITPLSAFPYALNVVQNPFYAAGRKICIRNKARSLLDCGLITLLYQFLTECCTAAALPHYGRIYRLACFLIPNHNGFTLVHQ